MKGLSTGEPWRQQSISVSHYTSMHEILSPLSVLLLILECVSFSCEICVFSLVSIEHCEAIAECRRQLRKIDKSHIIFLDETALRVNAAPTHTLVAPGENSYVVVEDDTSYARRYDMIACCSLDRVFPPIIYTPNERRQEGVSGINGDMLISYIQNVLAQALGALDLYPLILVLDRSPIHNEEKIMEAFHDWGCQELTQVIKMPTQAAKRMSPLDNALFHDWKERCRKHARITNRNIEQIMADEWNKTTSSQLNAHYHNCLLFQRQNVYADCPSPSSHRHCT